MRVVNFRFIVIYRFNLSGVFLSKITDSKSYGSYLGAECRSCDRAAAGMNHVLETRESYITFSSIPSAQATAPETSRKSIVCSLCTDYVIGLAASIVSSQISRMQLQCSGFSYR